MYGWTTWLDQVWDDSTVFLIEDLGNDQYRITRAGSVIQLGTEQDALHFNNIEGGVVDPSQSVTPQLPSTLRSNRSLYFFINCCGQYTLLQSTELLAKDFKRGGDHFSRGKGD